MEAEIANIALRVAHRVDTRRKALSFRRNLSCRSMPPAAITFWRLS
jgi:hypothetical protein